MNINKLVAPVGIAAIAVGMAGVTAGPASAANNIKPFGQQETLNDYGTGAPMIGYTVKGLGPSSDPVPHNGQLYAATVKVAGLGGWATPLIPLFNARAESGANYRVIGGGLPSAPPGGTTTGKLYFDVVGDVPNSVVYNDGSHDILGWIQPPGVSPAETPGGSTSNSTGPEATPGGSSGGSGGAEGVTGSTGPNEAVPNVTAPENGGEGSGSGGTVGSGVGPGPGGGRGR